MATTPEPTLSDGLIVAATAARRRAYAPYSRFQVGAAVRDETGAIHAGCNVENAAYPEGTCAEAGAIAAMIHAGGHRVCEAVVAGPEGMTCTPCGGCRQKLREFALPETRIIMVDANGEIMLTRTLAELLPDAFGPDHLG